MALADGVAGLQRVLGALVFAAEVGEEVEVVGGGVAVVEVEVDVLVQAGAAALSKALADEVAQGGVVAAGSEVVDEPGAEGGGVGLGVSSGGGSSAMLPGKLACGNVVQQSSGLRRDALRGDGVVGEGLAGIGVSGIAAGIVDGDGQAARGSQVLKVAGALGGQRARFRTDRRVRRIAGRRG